MTAAVTLGFVHGCAVGQAFFKLKDVSAKNAMLKRGYFRSVLSLVGLAFCASLRSGETTANVLVMACAVAILSATLSSSLAFQFYQLPNMVTSGPDFLQHKALSLAYLDGIGFFLAAPIWAVSGRVAQSLGWAITWSLLAILVTAGATVMMLAVQPTLQTQQQGTT